MGNRLAGKRVFITQSNAYMGPAIEALFSGEGAIVSAKPGRVTGRFQKHLQRNVPVQRVAKAEESAELALFLASGNSNFIVGQVVPFSGGWVTTT